MSCNLLYTDRGNPFAKITAGRAGLFTNQLAEELLKALYNQYLSPLLPIAQREAL